ncbi:MAG TPA: hypothetical protein VNZ26_12415 [Vicinamibacterales bacterium]|nr:hypothetical protein [Vicinamibacterales bacterium]
MDNSPRRLRLGDHIHGDFSQMGRSPSAFAVVPFLLDMSRTMGRRPRSLLIVLALWGSVAGAACSSPTKPGVSVVAAKPASPSTGSSFSYYSQPVTLVVTTGVATGGALPTSTVEVATDAAFTTLVTTQTVSAGATGQVTVTLDHLSPSTTYYWRVKTAAGNNPGLYSSPASFSVGPLLIIQAPALVQPLADTFPHKRPTFIVTNAVRTGPPATITYRFDVATDAAFSTIVTTGTVPEATTQTSFTPSVDLSSGATYYWRTQAHDATKGVTGPYSSLQTFTTVNPDDGNFPYTLHVHCSTRYGSDYDSQPGLLNVSGDKLRLTLLPSLNLQITRVGKRLSGTMGGQFKIFIPYVLDIGAKRSLPGWGPEGSASLSGDAADDGVLSGTFEGYVFLGYYPEGHECVGPLAWTLTPH